MRKGDTLHCIVRYILFLSVFMYCITAIAQQRERTVSISCYVNPELYIQAGVIAYVSDKTGNISCKGQYISIQNNSRNPFYYNHKNRWTAVNTGKKAVIQSVNANNTSSGSPSIIKLNVRYSPDLSGDIAAKIRAIAQMNAETDRVKAGGPGGSLLKGGGTDKPSNESAAKKNQPDKSRTAAVSSVKSTAKEGVEKKAAATPKALSQNEVKLKRKREIKKEARIPANALGLRIDFGTGQTGLGPNYKYKLNRKLSVDAAIVFFEDDAVSLTGQLEHNIALQGVSGLSWYIGIGPQFLFDDDDTETGLVPVTGLEYGIAATPINFSLDWRPCFYLSSQNRVEAGRFGLSFRFVF